RRSDRGARGQRPNAGGTDDIVILCSTMRRLSWRLPGVFRIKGRLRGTALAHLRKIAEWGASAAAPPAGVVRGRSRCALSTAVRRDWCAGIPALPTACEHPRTANETRTETVVVKGGAGAIACGVDVRVAAYSGVGGRPGGLAGCG
ncbi:MAG TPA: hypothetical protein VEL76_31040, partial [Gemmataceae bacterium]|nr:hypothetical protein [Gemmataceae bacterium]